MISRCDPSGNGHSKPEREVTVRDLLTDAQVKHVLDIMSKEPDSAKRVEKVTKYLMKFHKHLVMKEVVPRYLAYYFEWLLEHDQLP